MIRRENLEAASGRRDALINAVQLAAIGLLAGPIATSAADNSNSDQAASSASDPEQSTELEAIQIEADELTPFGPTQGIVPEVTGTGTKTATPIDSVPQSMSVITRDRMTRQGMDSTEDAFRYTPGVTGEVNGDDTRVNWLNFRGFTDNGKAVYRDTLQLRSQGFAQFNPELYGVERVEVLRGPASMLYGQANPGGLVNLVTKRPTSEPFGELGVEYGNLDHKELKFDAGGPLNASGSVLGRVTGVVRDSDAQVDSVDDDRVYLAPALTFRPSADTTFTLLSRFQRDDTGSTNQFVPAAGTIRDNPNGDLDPDAFLGNEDFDDFERESYAVGYNLTHEVSDRLTMRQNARYNDLDTTSEAVFGGGLQADQRTLDRSAFATDSTMEGLTVDTNAEMRFTTGPAEHTLLGGVGFQRYEFTEEQRFASAPSIDVFKRNNRGTIGNVPVFQDTEQTQRQIGVYAQDQIRINDQYVVTLGGRHDWVDTDETDNLANTSTDQDDSEFTGRAGFAYESDLGVTPYVSYATSFQPLIGVNAEGKPFEPTTGEQWEAGVRYRPDGIDALVSLAGYNLVRQNIQVTDPNNPNNDVQVGEVRSRGVEFETQANLDSGLNLTASFTLRDVEKTEDTEGFEGKRPRQVAEEKASIWADYTVASGSLDGLNIGAGLRYQGENFADNANDVEVDGFTVADAAVSYDWNKFTLRLRGENIFDEEFVSSCTSTDACFFGATRRARFSIERRW